MYREFVYLLVRWAKPEFKGFIVFVSYSGYESLVRYTHTILSHRGICCKSRQKNEIQKNFLLQNRLSTLEMLRLVYFGLN